eukprot:6012788-Prymnesium_polylepis.1
MSPPAVCARSSKDGPTARARLRQEVDLSYNRIVRIEGLDTLDELKRLVRPPQSPHPNQG